jgi:hypothetical protein
MMRHLLYIPGKKILQRVSRLIKSQDLMLRPRLLYRVITHNILSKKGYFDEVTFIDLCLIDCMIRRRTINFPYIIMKNLIMQNDKKQKSLPYGQCLTTIFEHFDVEFTDSRIQIGHHISNI